MNQFKKVIKRFWKDEAGQGTAEYVLLLVLVVGIIMAFGGQIKSAIQAKVGEVSGNIQGFSGQ